MTYSLHEFTAWRKALTLNQKEAAVRLGCHVQSVKSLEIGRMHWSKNWKAKFKTAFFATPPPKNGKPKIVPRGTGDDSFNDKAEALAASLTWDVVPLSR